MTSHINLDSENLSVTDISNIRYATEDEVIYIFSSVAKCTYDVQVIQAVLETKGKVELIITEASGKKSLDFYITAFAAKQAMQFPDDKVYVISADSDFRHIQNMSRLACNKDMAEIVQFKSVKDYMLAKENDIDEVPISIESYKFLAK